MDKKSKKNTIVKQRQEIQHKEFRSPRITTQVRVSIEQYSSIKKLSKVKKMTISKTLDQIVRDHFANKDINFTVQCPMCKYQYERKVNILRLYDFTSKNDL